MSKDDIKTRILPTQNNICPLSNLPLPTDKDLLRLCDTDRITPRCEGGTYNDENTRIVDPRAHMERHGILRDRDEWTEHLKSLMDDYVQTKRLMLKIGNQLLAYQRRTDHLNPETLEFLQAALVPHTKRKDALQRKLAKHLKTSKDPLVHSALGVRSLGPVTVAGLTIYVDLTKADSASSLWKYVGLHAPAHERYIKGRASGGNKTLRTILFSSAESLMKDTLSAYRPVYDQVKRRLSDSDRLVVSYNNQKQQVTVPWKDTMAKHRHGAALRAVSKHILADYWFVGRTLYGLSTRPLYAQTLLGHDGFIQPNVRGWVY